MSITAEPFSIFHLSRQYAWFNEGTYQLHSRYLQPEGMGVRLDTNWNGLPLQLWVPEAQWCAWLAPQLVVPTLADIEIELQPLLATWSLLTLGDFIQKLGLPAYDQVNIQPSPAPQQAGWQIEIQQEDLRLPLFFQVVPDTLIQAILEVLEPDEMHRLDLSLSLGWCLLEQPIWNQTKVGDAFLIEGMEADLASFWLHPACSPGRLRLKNSEQAQVTLCATPWRDLPEGTLCIQVEAGRLQITASELAQWEQDAELMVQVARYPALRLTTQGRLLALGQLLRFEDGWMVRISARGPLHFDSAKPASAPSLVAYPTVTDQKDLIVSEQ